MKRGSSQCGAIRESCKRGVKRALIALGKRYGPAPSLGIRPLRRFLELGRWLSRRGFENSLHFETRNQVFEAAARELSGGPLVYIELGVGDGTSLRYWTGLVRDSRAVFHGFDTFWGLPEDWNRRAPRGTYSQAGRPPDIDDRRVRLFQGLFQDTLRDYEAPPHEGLVIVFDADLYSSTRFALGSLRKLVKPGTLPYFDEFNDVQHEMRAFEEFLRQVPHTFTLVAEAREYQHALFRCLTAPDSARGMTRSP